MVNQKEIIKKCLASSIIIWISSALLLIASLWLIFAEPVADFSYWISKQRAGKILGIIGICIGTPGILAITKNMIFIIVDFYSCKTIQTDICLYEGWTMRLPTHTFHIVASPKRMFLPLPGINYWFYLFSRSYYIVTSEMMNANMKKGNPYPKQIVATKWAHIVLTIE